MSPDSLTTHCGWLSHHSLASPKLTALSPLPWVAPSMETLGGGLYSTLHGLQLISGHSPTYILCPATLHSLPSLNYACQRFPFWRGLVIPTAWWWLFQPPALLASPGLTSSFRPSPQLGRHFMQVTCPTPKTLWGAALQCFPEHPHFCILGLCSHTCLLSRSSSGGNPIQIWVIANVFTLLFPAPTRVCGKQEALNKWWRSNE